jgi:holo-[acyl-carrier protein] synthase
VGIDLVSVAEVRESIDTHGERYTQFVYTERELADCTTEAALKALAPSEEGIQFSSIEVCREQHGSVALELSGRAAELAERVGVSELALSIAHEAGFACAVVVAQ